MGSCGVEIRNLLTSQLLVFPAISAFFAVSRIVTYVISDDLRFIGSTLKIVFALLVVSVQYAQYLLRLVFIMFTGNAETWLPHQIRIDFRAVIVKKLKFRFFHNL